MALVEDEVRDTTTEKKTPMVCRPITKDSEPDLMEKAWKIITVAERTEMQVQAEDSSHTRQTKDQDRC